MKNITSIVLVLFIFSGSGNHLAGQTLKERIDQAQNIKVYFQYGDIVSAANTTTQVGNSSSDSGCENFKETVPLPPAYQDATKQVIELLNHGFGTNIFAEGNLSAVSDLPLNHEGELNWLLLGEPLTFYVSTSGAYTIRRYPGHFDRENSLEIQSHFKVYSVSEGRLKNLETIFLASVKSAVVKTDPCSDYTYFVNNFPAASLTEPFQTSLTENVEKFIEKQLEKYNKAMKKKK